MVSLGPGDWELITIKAINAIKDSNAICIQTKSSDLSFNKSLTFQIVQKILEQFNLQKKIIPIYTPMRFKQSDWEKEAAILIDAIKQYKKVSFTTLGDASIYSTVYYLLDHS